MQIKTLVPCVIFELTILKKLHFKDFRKINNIQSFYEKKFMNVREMGKYRHNFLVNFIIQKINIL